MTGFSVPRWTLYTQVALGMTCSSLKFLCCASWLAFCLAERDDSASNTPWTGFPLEVTPSILNSGILSPVCL